MSQKKFQAQYRRAFARLFDIQLVIFKNPDKIKAWEHGNNKIKHI